MSEGWTEEKVARLRAMVEEAASAAAIAEALGDVTRPAVIGKCHRLGLELKLPPGGEGRRLAREANAGGAIAPRRAKAQASTPKPPKTAKPTPPPPPVILMPEIEPTPKLWPKPAGPEAVTIEQLRDGHCHMPLWGDEAKAGLYCGKPVGGEGQSWGTACAKLAYEVRPVRERELREMQQVRMAKQSRSGAFA